MKGIVLAGGLGKRIMPLTHYKPKPIIPVGNRPVIDYAVSRLVTAGIKDITFALAYKPYEIVDYVCGYLDVNAVFSIARDSAGTAGSAKRALTVDDTFVVLSSDTIDAEPLKNVIERHKESGAIATMQTVTVDDLSQYGSVSTCDGYLTDIFEKDQTLKGKSGIANSGTYVLNKAVFDYIPSEVPFDFAKDLFPKLLGAGEKVAVYHSNAYWKDVGNPVDYYNANFEVLDEYFSQARHVGRVNNYRKNGSLVSETALVTGRIKNCIIGDGAVITSRADLTDCIVLPGEYVDFSANGYIIGGNYDISPLASGINMRNCDNPTNIFSLFAIMGL